MMEATVTALDLSRRLRRNRLSPAIRALVQETRLHPSDLVSPLFVMEGEGKRDPILAMPEIDRLSIDLLVAEAKRLHSLGIQAIALFPVIDSSLKDENGSEALNAQNLACRTIENLKKEIPELCVIIDIALDPYTSHGHDGLVDAANGRILNDETVAVLAEMSVILARAGADIVAPSDMMDGRIGAIRKALDQAELVDTSILSYAAKYASAFYGPFRDALHSAPKFGNKKTYQMNPANRREASLECSLDISEGADMLMIKPALPYLDVIAEMRRQYTLPIAAYHVSGEYSMVMAAAEKGWIDADQVFLESLLSIKRAGADFILSYAAGRIAEQLQRIIH